MNTKGLFFFLQLPAKNAAEDAVNFSLQQHINFNLYPATIFFVLKKLSSFYVFSSSVYIQVHLKLEFFMKQTIWTLIRLLPK